MKLKMGLKDKYRYPNNIPKRDIGDKGIIIFFAENITRNLTAVHTQKYSLIGY